MSPKNNLGGWAAIDNEFLLPESSLMRRQEESAASETTIRPKYTTFRGPQL
jgi:hypothetical protein